MQEGLVIRTTGSWYRVLLADGGQLDCRLRGNYRLRGNKQTNPVAVGDRVLFELQDDGTGVIHEVRDRRNYIVRRATKLSKQTHVIAANIDLLCIVATLGLPRTSTGFIDRLLVTAEAYHIPACIIFNKCDLLVDDELRALQDELSALYRNVGYPVLEVSALKGTNLDAVKEMIAGKTVLFSGHSGVGKSALLNALCPGLGLRVGELSDWSLKGKHTTTFAEIFPIRVMGYGLEVMDACAEPRQPSITHNPSPITYLIDTPGIKEFGMVDFNEQELSHFFPEMRAVLHNCHFANCTHRHEPQCAVKAAVEEGRISEERYRNYLNIIEGIDQT
jgi:ribosome biogenesis GTPase